MQIYHTCNLSFKRRHMNKLSKLAVSNGRFPLAAVLVADNALCCPEKSSDGEPRTNHEHQQRHDEAKPELQRIESRTPE